MSEYKRLTKKDKYGHWYTETKIYDRFMWSSDGKVWERDLSHYAFDGEAIDRLAELEDKIEQGTLKHFPCNIGDEVFWACDLDKQYSQVMHGVVIGLSISHKNTVWFSVKYDDGLSFDHTAESWGKSVFLTKAEAEAKLKE